MLYDELLQTDYEKAAWAVSDILRDRGAVVGDTTYGVMALEMLRRELGVEGALDEVLDKVKESGAFKGFVTEYLGNALSAVGDGDVRLANLDGDEVRAYVAHAEAGSFATMRESVTPSPIVVLATEILEIGEGERVADFGCGQGLFLAYAASHHQGASYVGYDVNPSAAAVAALRAHALGLDEVVSVECMDLFDYAAAGEGYDKVFSHYPIGMRFPKIKTDSWWLKEVASGKAGYDRPVVFDWVFNQLVLDSLEDGGIGVVLTSDGALVNVSDEGVRATFVDCGWIRNIVKLPGNLLPDTNAGCNLMVLGQGYGGVHFLDATKLAVEGRRKNTLSPKAVEVIATYVKEMVYEGGEEELEQISQLIESGESRVPASISWGAMIITGDRELNALFKSVDNCTASATAIASVGYKLDARYLTDDVYEDDDRGYIGESLGKHILSIGRGVTLRASELDELTVSYDTGVRYLAPTGIEDGLILDDLPFLSELTPKLEKHTLRNGDLLISRIGQPYRIAVAEVPEGMKIVPSSNVFVVRVDPEDVDPYYLAAFLQSSRGEWELSKASSGSAVPSISSRTLREITIPYLMPYETEDAVEAYQAKIEEIRLTKERLAKAREDLRDLLD